MKLHILLNYNNFNASALIKVDTILHHQVTFNVNKRKFVANILKTLTSMDIHLFILERYLNGDCSQF